LNGSSYNPQETTMKKTILTLAAAVVASGALAQDAGIVSRPSKFSVAETADRLESAIKASGTYKLFLRLDHAANAKEVGATLKPSQLILFGNPKGGAPLLEAAPTLGLDLPNRALIWEDAAGKVWLSYNDVRQVLGRHGVKRSEEQLKAIDDRQKALLDKAIE
jgi:uncharacterized protein (DUF302 family)